MNPYYYWYVAGCIGCSLLVYVFMRDTKHHSRIDLDYREQTR